MEKNNFNNIIKTSENNSINNEDFSVDNKETKNIDATIDYFKKLSEEDKKSVLYGLKINEKNFDLANKMYEIDKEMSKTFPLPLNNEESTKTTNKEVENVYLKKHIKENLTKPSKYVKGALISGLIGAGLSADFLLNGPISSSIHNIDTMTWTEIISAVTLLGNSVRQGVKSITQSVKTKLATNESYQRMIALHASGASLDTARNVVYREVQVKHDEVGGEPEVVRKIKSDPQYREEDFNNIDPDKLKEIIFALRENDLYHIDHDSYK